MSDAPICYRCGKQSCECKGGVTLFHGEKNRGRSYTGVVMLRSAAEAWGLRWPPDWAAIDDGRVVTWAEVHARRRQRQEENLASKRKPSPRRCVPVYVWTFQVPGFLFGGWWAYLVSVEYGTDEGRGENFGPKGEIHWGPLAESIMRACPLGLLPKKANWATWMIALADHRPRRHKHDPRPSGSLIGWYDRVGHRFDGWKDESRHH